MTTPHAEHLRAAAEILGETASPAEVIIAANFIRRGYLNADELAAVAAIGVERARTPEPVEFELAETDGQAVVTGAHSSVEFGFAPEVDDYWTEEDRGPRRRR